MDSSPPERLSRSPHPYHRRRIGPFGEPLVQRTGQEGGHLSSSGEQLFASTWFSRENLQASGNHGRTHREGSIFQTESGSEADDEGQSLLRGLPAPPLAQRKGLRGAAESGRDDTVSLGGTSGYVNGSPRSLSAELRRLRGERRSTTPDVTVDARKKADTFRRRRRAELARRMTEVTLVGALGGIVLGGQEAQDQSSRDYRGIAGRCILTLGRPVVYSLRDTFQHPWPFRLRLSSP